MRIETVLYYKAAEMILQLGTTLQNAHCLQYMCNGKSIPIFQTSQITTITIPSQNSPSLGPFRKHWRGKWQNLGESGEPRLRGRPPLGARMWMWPQRSLIARKNGSLMSVSGTLWLEWEWTDTHTWNLWRSLAAVAQEGGRLVTLQSVVLI